MGNDDKAESVTFGSHLQDGRERDGLEGRSKQA